ncbi:MAG: hypothetical protein AAB459_03645, partial [Patescibacteria group bacterium]
MGLIEASSRKKRVKFVLYVLIVIMTITDIVLLGRYLINGKNIALLNPKGFIAEQQYSLMMFTIATLMLIAIPSLFTLYFTAWKYRESNTKIHQATKSKHSKYLVFTMWLVPTVIMIVLAVVMWSGTHKLVPQKQISSDKKPLTVQVIS